MLVYAGANVVGRDAHRPVHAAAPREPGGQRGRRRGAAQGGRGRRSAARRPPASPPLHLAAAAGNADVVKLLLDARRRRQREGIRVGPDAADVRGGAEPRRRDQGAARARRRSEDHDQDHRHRQAGRSSIARPPSASARCSRPRCRRASSRRRARFRRRCRRRASSWRPARFRRRPRPLRARCCAWRASRTGGPERAAAGDRGQQLRSRRDQPAGRDARAA